MAPQDTNGDIVAKDLDQSYSHYPSQRETIIKSETVAASPAGAGRARVSFTEISAESAGRGVGEERPRQFGQVSDCPALGAKTLLQGEKAC